MPEESPQESRVAAERIARWLRLLRLLFTVILLAVGTYNAIGGLP